MNVTVLHFAKMLQSDVVPESHVNIMFNLDQTPNQDACDVSIIIPIGPGDNSWHGLIDELRQTPFFAEIICVGTTAQTEFLTEARPVKWVISPRGRARQMNVGAAQARGRFLWFLHADSRFDLNTLEALQRSWTAAPAALLYFNLVFQTDGPRWMPLNAWGVWFRSHWLGMPFGDQGLCLNRELFDQLGGYSEVARYGEDHLLVWTARRRGIPLHCTGGTLHTSARKYREYGWFRTTCRHVWLTLLQACP
ncbi:MAG: putative glycosyltransferase, partial [Planctomycetaceae bacterium]|nr:putative glycosyltransferase [Planctomycetaceae bacterium]